MTIVTTCCASCDAALRGFAARTPLAIVTSEHNSRHSEGQRVSSASSRLSLSRRLALATVSAWMPTLVPLVASALPPDGLAAARLAQSQLLDEHSERFFRRTTSLQVDENINVVVARVATTVYRFRPMRELVATADIAAGTRVAAYPVEVASRATDEFDSTYAVRLYWRPQWQVIYGAAGVLTTKSLSRAYIDGLPTIAMFANEPDARSRPNCVLRFPSTEATSVRVGDVLSGELETIVDVPRGAALTYCYYPREVERAYPTMCSAVGRHLYRS